MNPTRHQFCLTSRDVLLLRYLFATKGATGKQIRRDIFNNISGQAVRRRLGILCKAGLIKRSSVYIKRPITVFFVSKKALRSGIVYDFKLPRMEAQSSNITHELSLVDIRQKCLMFEDIEYYLTENELQSELFGEKEYSFEDYVRLNSDGFIRLRIGENIFSGAIEYEQSEKGKSQYESLFLNYYQSLGVSFVFYITINRRILNSILRHDQSVRGNRKAIIFGTTLNKFLNSEESISLESSSARFLEIPLRKSL